MATVLWIESRSSPSACRIGHGRWQEHQTPTVERQDLWLLERPHGLERSRGEGGRHLHDGFAERERHVSSRELIDECTPRRMTKRDMPPAGREVEDAAVFAEWSRCRPRAGSPATHAGDAKRRPR